MTKDEGLKLALEALEGAEDQLAKPYSTQARYAITAIREALAQPEHDWEAAYIKQVELHNQTLDELRDALAQPEQEPVAWQERQAKRMHEGVVTEWTNWYPCRYRTIDEAKAEACDHIPYEWRPLYTTPPQRKPLTDEEIDFLWQNTSPYYDHQDFARAIEAAHGIKE